MAFTIIVFEKDCKKDDGDYLALSIQNDNLFFGDTTCFSFSIFLCNDQQGSPSGNSKNIIISESIIITIIH